MNDRNCGGPLRRFRIAGSSVNAPLLQRTPCAAFEAREYSEPRFASLDESASPAMPADRLNPRSAADKRGRPRVALGLPQGRVEQLEPAAEMRQIETKSGKRWRCIKSIQAAKQGSEARAAFGRQTTELNRAEAQSKARIVLNARR